MAAPNLPPAVIQMLAAREMRIHHARWHYVRDNWGQMSQQERDMYDQMGWRPPRLTGENGAGLDFLFMHRQMIGHVNQMLAQIGDPNYPQVVGWAPIPWDPNDADWPMPPVYDPQVAWAKDAGLTDQFHAEVANKFENNGWLQNTTLDAAATDIETGIHNWLHMHFSAAPWFTGAPGQNQDDSRNDYLGSTYSSHVNKAFWKLHGWIDDRISQWEQASGQQADFSQSWEGPGQMHGPHPFDMRRADRERVMPLTKAEAAHAARKFLKPVAPKRTIGGRVVVR